MNIFGVIDISRHLLHPDCSVSGDRVILSPPEPLTTSSHIAQDRCAPLYPLSLSFVPLDSRAQSEIVHYFFSK